MRLQIDTRKLMAVAIIVLQVIVADAQNIKHRIEQAKVYIDDEKYSDGYKILQDINESQVNELGDSCLMLYNYGKGACLYFMDKYEDPSVHSRMKDANK